MAAAYWMEGEGGQPPSPPHHPEAGSSDDTKFPEVQPVGGATGRRKKKVTKSDLPPFVRVNLSLERVAAETEIPEWEVQRAVKRLLREGLLIQLGPEEWLMNVRAIEALPRITVPVTSRKPS